MRTDPGVVPDASALAAYARNDLRSLAVDELLRELREDTGGAVHIPCCALNDAMEIIRGDKAATARLESFAAAHGTIDLTPDVAAIRSLLVAEAGISPGLAHAIIVASVHGAQLATHVAALVRQAGFDERLILDLGELFQG